MLDKILSIILDFVLVIMTICTIVGGGVLLIIPVPDLILRALGVLLVLVGVPFFLMALVMLIEDIKEE